MKKSIVSAALAASMVMTACSTAGTNSTTVASSEASTTAQSTTAASVEAQASDLKDGTYEETVDGRNGKLTVTTTIKNGKIDAVEVGDNTETPEVLPLRSSLLILPL